MYLTIISNRKRHTKQKQKFHITNVKVNKPTATVKVKANKIKMCYYSWTKLS